MSFVATVFKIMIASPSDVTEERDVIREVIHEWNAINSEKDKIILLPVSWETHAVPEMGERPQEIINKQVLHDCDLLVGVFWTRLGTATGKYESGTVEEIELHTSQNKPAMLYFSQRSVPPNYFNNEQYSKLIIFRNNMKNKGYYEEYNDINEFRKKFRRQLQQIINKHEYFKIARNHNVNVPAHQQVILSEDAKRLLNEACQDSHGLIAAVKHLNGVDISTNGHRFTTGQSPREVARWEAAIEELEVHGLIKAKNPRRELFGVTKLGYDLCDGKN